MSEKETSQLPDWLRKVLYWFYTAFELLFVFLFSAYVLARISGNTTANGVKLQGWISFAPFFITGVYYRVMQSYLGGTLSARGTRWISNRFRRADSKK